MVTLISRHTPLVEEWLRTATEDVTPKDDEAAEVARRLQAIIPQVLDTPKKLQSGWRSLIREVAKTGRVEELHAERADYEAVYVGYLHSLADFERLARLLGSPSLADQFRAVAEETAELQTYTFLRWETLDDLKAIVAVETHPLTAEQLRRFAASSPPPQSWYDETIDPFAPAE